MAILFIAVGSLGSVVAYRTIHDRLQRGLGVGIAAAFVLTGLILLMPSMIAP
jgi:hypothetical protein